MCLCVCACHVWGTGAIAGCCALAAAICSSINLGSLLNRLHILWGQTRKAEESYGAPRHFPLTLSCVGACEPGEDYKLAAGFGAAGLVLCTLPYLGPEARPRLRGFGERALEADSCAAKADPKFERCSLRAYERCSTGLLTRKQRSRRCIESRSRSSFGLKPDLFHTVRFSVSFLFLAASP